MYPSSSDDFGLYGFPPPPFRVAQVHVGNESLASCQMDNLDNQSFREFSNFDSPSLLSILGMTAVAALTSANPKELKDYTVEAVQFFDAMRTPASLIAAASLSVLFTEEWYKGRLTGGSFHNVLSTGILSHTNSVRLGIFLTSSYQILIFSSFLFSIATVLLATSAGIGILNGNFNPYASSAYMLLKREFEFELLSARLGFFYSLFAFIIGVTTRFLLEFDLLNKQRESIIVLFGTLSVISHLTSYVNSTLICWNNLSEMTCSWFKVSFIFENDSHSWIAV